MSSLTRSKIAYDLNISPHQFVVGYHESRVKYYFSSELYKEKFESKLLENRDKINHSLSNRFGYSIEMDMLADLKLYITIEKRGFLIFKDDEKIECLNDIILDGNNLIVKN